MNMPTKFIYPKNKRNTKESFSKDDRVKSDASNSRIIKISDFPKFGSRLCFQNFSKIIPKLWVPCVGECIRSNFQMFYDNAVKIEFPLKFSNVPRFGEIQVSSLKAIMMSFALLFFQRPRDASLFFFF